MSPPRARARHLLLPAGLLSGGEGAAERGEAPGSFFTLLLCRRAGDLEAQREVALCEHPPYLQLSFFGGRAEEQPRPIPLGGRRVLQHRRAPRLEQVVPGL